METRENTWGTAGSNSQEPAMGKPAEPPHDMRAHSTDGKGSLRGWGGGGGAHRRKREEEHLSSSAEIQHTVARAAEAEGQDG